MTEFKAGQRVKVEYEGVVDAVGLASMSIRRDDGSLTLIKPDSVKVTILDPLDWPPQVGDIWEGNGMEWFATADDHVTPDNGEEDWHVSDFKTLNPALVRRRGQ